MTSIKWISFTPLSMIHVQREVFIIISVIIIQLFCWSSEQRWTRVLPRGVCLKLYCTLSCPKIVLAPRSVSCLHEHTRRKRVKATRDMPEMHRYTAMIWIFDGGFSPRFAFALVNFSLLLFCCLANWRKPRVHVNAHRKTGFADWRRVNPRYLPTCKVDFFLLFMILFF